MSTPTPGSRSVGARAMRGFPPQYTDIVDWIVRITSRIWEDGDIGYIDQTYAHDAVIVDDVGVRRGRDTVVADTVQQIAAFPDVRLHADEIVWAGDEDDGFHTSHRTVIVGHHTGPGRLGPPTGRRVVVWAIANCHAVAGEIVTEHVIYNSSSLLRQLGLDVPALARAAALRRAQVQVQAAAPGPAPPPTPDPTRDPAPVEAFLRTLYDDVWNHHDLGAIRRAYAPSIRRLGPGDERRYGRGALTTWILELQAMLPDLVMSVDDLYWMAVERSGELAAVRWSISGTHLGHGRWGAPSGKPVHLWGITQHEIRDGRIVEEWTVANDFAVLGEVLTP